MESHLIIWSTRIIYTPLSSVSVCNLKGSLVINIGIKKTKMGLDMSPNGILSGVWVVCLHLWCYTKGTHSNWSHAWHSHSLTWKQIIASVEENLEWSRFRKHISNAGLLLLCVLGIVFILLPAEGHSCRDKSVAILRLVGEWLTQQWTGFWSEDINSHSLVFCGVLGLLNVSRTIS